MPADVEEEKRQDIEHRLLFLGQHHPDIFHISLTVNQFSIRYMRLPTSFQKPWPQTDGLGAHPPFWTSAQAQGCGTIIPFFPFSRPVNSLLFRAIDMAREFPHAEVVGLDLSPPSLNR